MLATLADIVLVVGFDDRIAFINHVAPDYDRSTVLGQPMTASIPPEQQGGMVERVHRVRATGEPEDYEVESISPAGDRAWWSSRMTLLRCGDDAELVLIIARDVTEIRVAEAKRLAVASELRKVMELLPICAWCKRVRDDEGFWEDVSSNIQNTTGVAVSHGICPACVESLRSDAYAPADHR